VRPVAERDVGRHGFLLPSYSLAAGAGRIPQCGPARRRWTPRAPRRKEGPMSTEPHPEPAGTRVADEGVQQQAARPSDQPNASIDVSPGDQPAAASWVRSTTLPGRCGPPGTCRSPTAWAGSLHFRPAAPSTLTSAGNGFSGDRTHAPDHDGGQPRPVRGRAFPRRRSPRRGDVRRSRMRSRRCSAPCGQPGGSPTRPIPSAAPSSATPSSGCPARPARSRSGSSVGGCASQTAAPAGMARTRRCRAIFMLSSRSAQKGNRSATRFRWRMSGFRSAGWCWMMRRRS